jgi:hypothetical protein
MESKAFLRARVLRGELIIIPSSVAAPRRDVLIIFREIHLRDETRRQYTADFSIQEADCFPNDFYINVTLAGEVARIGYAAVILQIVDGDKFRELLEKSRDNSTPRKQIRQMQFLFPKASAGMFDSASDKWEKSELIPNMGAFENNIADFKSPCRSQQSSNVRYVILESILCRLMLYEIKRPLFASCAFGFLEDFFT